MTETLDANSGEINEISTESKIFLLESAKWARFLAIVGFVMLGLMLIAALFIIGAGSSIRGFAGNAAVMGVMYILMAALYFFPTYYLFRFATKIKAGLTTGNQADTIAGFENLKSMFKFMGILMIIVLVIYGIAILIGIVGALSM